MASPPTGARLSADAVYQVPRQAPPVGSDVAYLAYRTQWLPLQPSPDWQPSFDQQSVSFSSGFANVMQLTDTKLPPASRILSLRMFAMGTAVYSPKLETCPIKARLIAELEESLNWVDSIANEEMNSIMTFDGVGHSRVSQALAVARKNRSVALEALKEHIFEHEC